MQFFTLLVSALSLVSVAVSTPTERATTTLQVTYDPIYDVGSNSLDIVACSNGPNGLETKGYTTFGSLPTFPNIGGAQAIAGWNSPNCGTCWQLTYANHTIKVLAVDHARAGFNIGLQAMNKLTGNHAEEYGVVQATVKELAPSACGL